MDITPLNPCEEEGSGTLLHIWANVIGPKPRRLPT